MRTTEDIFDVLFILIERAVISAKRIIILQMNMGTFPHFFKENQCEC